MAVVADPGSGSFSAPQALFKTPLVGAATNIDQFDVTEDGERFLFLVPTEGEVAAPITVMVNWQAALGARAP